MNILQAIILAVVQGITEWLPVSSTGHLVILQKLMDITQPVYFEIILHLASLLVILLAFRRRIMQLIKGVLRGNKHSLLFFYKLIIASIPIAFVGLAFNSTVKAAFENTNAVAAGLFITAAFIFSTQFDTSRKNFTSIKASIIGIAQAVAILPGVSRSGTTISTGLFLGIRREDAAFFSFMLFIPAILGATILEIPNISSNPGWTALLAGFIFTFFSGYLSLKWLLKTLKNQSFHLFGYYCIALGIVILIFM